MKKTIKIINILLIIAMVALTFSTFVFADVDPSQITGKGTGTDDTQIKQLGNKIVGLIRTVGTIISVGILVVLGIKYMTASPEGKADYKSTMIPYLVGAILVFAATWIATAIYNFADTMTV